MFAHAKAELPNEACGILAGQDGQAVKFFPTTNMEHSPTRYVVDPRDQLRVDGEIRAQGWELFGIFHSHTHTQAYPSSTDVSLAANWPEAYYLIASLQSKTPGLRAYRILDGHVEEQEIAPDLT
jgi:[CysO sulfur-carrier protein]-S-L-cysteine hydrolase